MKVLTKISTTATILMFAIVLLLRGNLLLGRLVANGATIGFAQKLMRSQQDPFELWLQCPPQADERPEVLYTYSQRGTTDPAVLAAQGMASWLAGYCTEAAESYAAAANGAPWNDVYWSRLGFIYYAMGNRDASADALRHLPSWKPLLSLGNVARKLGRPGFVKLCFQLAYEKAPDNLWLAEQLSEIYVSQGEPERAIALWEDRVNSTAPADPDHWWAMGQLYMAQSDYESAAEAFRQGATLSPSYTLVYREGNAWRKAGEFAKALQVYERAISLAPNDFWPHWGAGRMALYLGNQERACQFFRKADQFSPNHPVNQEYLALCSP